MGHPREEYQVEARELKIGDRFSYTGSFKVYRVQTTPRACPMFGDKRVVFEVSDEGLRDRMTIRLPAGMRCDIQSESDTIEKLEFIFDEGHIEHWEDRGEWLFFFDEDKYTEVSASGRSLEEVVRKAYEKCIAHARATE